MLSQAELDTIASRLSTIFGSPPKTPPFNALSNGAISKLNFLVSGRVSVVMSTFSVFGLSYWRSDNEFCAEEGQTPIFDPLPRNEKMCGNP